MNVEIRKLMRRKGSVKEGYDRRSLMGRGGIIFGGGRIIGRGKRMYFGGELEARGTGLLGVLGTGARIPFGFLELGSWTCCS
jgi:hypothetical protein